MKEEKEGRRRRGRLGVRDEVSVQRICFAGMVRRFFHPRFFRILLANLRSSASAFSVAPHQDGPFATLVLNSEATLYVQYALDVCARRP